jgi:RNA chaperone Hfq
MGSTIETRFLTSLIESKTPVAVYLKNGIKLKGQLLGFDRNSLFLQDSKNIQMILVNSVSTTISAQRF